MTSATQEARFQHEALHAMRRLVADLRRPNPWIFWSDLTATAIVFWAAVVFGALAASPWMTGLATIVAGLALTRGLLFVHEITHLRKGALPGFRFAWNAIIGVPLLAPSFIYETVHVDHHKVNVYRTDGDPEHAPDHKTLLQRCLVALAASLLLPVLFFVRFAIVAPLSLTSPRLRAWVERHLSGLSANLRYRPTPLKPAARRQMILAEAACFAWAVALVALVAAGTIPVQGVIVAMLAVSIAMAVTDLRGEILHRFNDEGSFGTLERQVRDSVNIPHTGPATWLLMPLGIAYHALHHLDMGIPYHNMAKAHARLMAHLPADSIYVRSTTDGLWTATLNAIADDAQHRAEESARTTLAVAR